jgi:hypothetical protein
VVERLGKELQGNGPGGLPVIEGALQQNFRGLGFLAFWLFDVTSKKTLCKSRGVVKSREEFEREGVGVFSEIEEAFWESQHFWGFWVTTKRCHAKVGTWLRNLETIPNKRNHASSPGRRGPPSGFPILWFRAVGTRIGFGKNPTKNFWTLFCQSRNSLVRMSESRSHFRSRRGDRVQDSAGLGNHAEISKIMHKATSRLLS